MEILTNSLEIYAITKDTIRFKSCLHYSHDIIIHQINQIQLNHDIEHFETFYNNLKYTSDLINHYNYEFDQVFYAFLLSIITHLNNYLKINYTLNENILKFFDITISDPVIILEYYLDVYEHILENIPDKSSKRRKLK